jgi:hypothetical protein
VGADDEVAALVQAREEGLPGAVVARRRRCGVDEQPTPRTDAVPLDQWFEHRLDEHLGAKRIPAPPRVVGGQHVRRDVFFSRRSEVPLDRLRQRARR